MIDCVVSNSQWISDLATSIVVWSRRLLWRIAANQGPKLIRYPKRAGSRAEGPNAVQSSMSFAGAVQ